MAAAGLGWRETTTCRREDDEGRIRIGGRNRLQPSCHQGGLKGEMRQKEEEKGREVRTEGEERER